MVNLAQFLIFWGSLCSLKNESAIYNPCLQEIFVFCEDISTKFSQQTVFLLREIKCNLASDGAFTIFMNILWPPMVFMSLPVGSKLEPLHVCLLLHIIINSQSLENALAGFTLQK